MTLIALSFNGSACVLPCRRRSLRHAEIPVTVPTPPASCSCRHADVLRRSRACVSWHRWRWSVAEPPVFSFQEELLLLRLLAAPVHHSHPLSNLSDQHAPYGLHSSELRTHVMTLIAVSFHGSSCVLPCRLALVRHPETPATVPTPRASYSCRHVDILRQNCARLS